MMSLVASMPTTLMAMSQPKPTVPEASEKTDPAPYPEAQTEPTEDTLNGYTVADPYRWMEQPGAADTWVDQENTYTQHWLDSHRIPGLDKRVTEIFDIGFVAAPVLTNGRLFFIKRDGDIEQPILYAKINGDEKELVDPNKLDVDALTTIDWYFPSSDGKLLAYGLSKNGSEDSTLYIMDVDTRQNLPDVIPETRHCSLQWLKDGSGFFYTRYPLGDRYNRKAYFHTLGTDWAEDPLIFGDKRDKTDWTIISLSDDAKKLMILEYRGWSDTDLYLYDLTTQTTKVLFLDLGGVVKGASMSGNDIYLLVDRDAPKGRVVRFTPDKPDPANWQTIIPEGKDPIESFGYAKGHIMLLTLEDVAHHLYVYDKNGERLGEITQPTLGSIEIGSLDTETGDLAYLFTSFFYPVTLFTSSIADDGPFKAEKAVAVTSNIDIDSYEVRQVNYPSYDGTWVNMFLVHRKGLAPNALTPTLLYGYGGFQVSMAPYFSRRVLAYIERGGLYAVANIRGGGEHGEAWHQAGMKANKHQVFRDFEYAARWLIKEHYTSPQHLIMEGGSNGGLLMGAMMTQCPELFAGAVSSVGLYDMIRYHKFPPGELWISEYGNADEATDTGYLLGYSPYHQILPGVNYPAFYGDTADTDTRVHWLHTAKFVAALQATTGGDAPILFHLDRKAGHGAGKKKTDIAQEYIDKFTFMFTVAGDPANMQ
jgi:prolyl oligopeptidase